MKEQKKVWRFFLISQFEQEEEWLNEMARKGWNFTGFDSLKRYVLERGTPREYIYKLDLVQKMDKQEYCDFLEEFNITLVGEWKEWVFLRKKASDGPFTQENDQFTKLRMTNKAYDYAIRNLCMLLKIFTIIIGLTMIGEGIFYSKIYAVAEFFQGMKLGVSIGSVFGLTLIFVPIITKLRKKINTLIEEISIKH